MTSAHAQSDQVPEPTSPVIDELVDEAEEARTAPAARPDDEALARRLLGVHVPQHWPAGLFCGNCRQRHPCQMHRWARDVLNAAGWTASAIDALDSRTGAWS